MSARRPLLAALTALAFIAMPAAPAGASVDVVNDILGRMLISGDGGDNEIQIDTNSETAGRPLRFIEAHQALGNHDGCVDRFAAHPPAPYIYNCFDVPAIVALFDEGDDKLIKVDDEIPTEAHGQLGDDELTGSSADDKLYGEGGGDTLRGEIGNDYLSDGGSNQPDTGSGGNDHLFGGPGVDFLDGGVRPGSGEGADELDGGTSNDVLDYSARTGALTITEGGGNDDGASGEGDNVINAETIIGGLAGDRISGAAEPNVLEGRRGADTLDGRGGADMLIGGLGSDTASYAGRIAVVTATLDGEAGDGIAGENDTIASDVESLTGGTNADKLTGSDGANVLRGGPMGDQLFGLGGDDGLIGEDGDDALTGASGDDALSGGGGLDTIAPGSGADTVEAGDGNDNVSARDDAKDVIGCGAGVDTVVADAVDSVAADCENVDRGVVVPPPGGGGTGGGGGGSGGDGGAGAGGGGAGGGGAGGGGAGADLIGPSLTLPARVVVRRRVAHIRAACPAAEGAAGCRAVRIAVFARGKRLGRGKALLIGGGKKRTLRVKLKRRPPAKIRLVASAADAAGNRATVRRNARALRR